VGPFVAALEAFVGGDGDVDFGQFGFGYWVFARRAGGRRRQAGDYPFRAAEGADYGVGSEGYFGVRAASHLRWRS
jgi:hypothetical protein